MDSFTKGMIQVANILSVIATVEEDNKICKINICFRILYVCEFFILIWW